MASAEVLAPTGSWTGSRYGRTTPPSTTGLDDEDHLQCRLGAIARCWVQIHTRLLKVWLYFRACILELIFFSSSVGSRCRRVQTNGRTFPGVICFYNGPATSQSLAPNLAFFFFYLFAPFSPIVSSLSTPAAKLFGSPEKEKRLAGC